MAVNAVQNKKMSYTGATIVGAVGGYSLKWAIPVISGEKNDTSYSSKLSDITKNSQKSRKDEFEKIKKEAHELPYGDEFVKMNQNGDLDYSKLEGFKGTKQEALTNLLARLDDAATSVKEEGVKELNTKTKALRPTSTFVFLGILAGLLTAALYNIAHRNKN
jgi:hypothetical protein